MSITYNNTIFSEPVLLRNWNPPIQAGLYVILKHDGNFTPRPFRAIYFGETGNFAERGFFGSHHKYWDWAMSCGNPNNIYIAFCSMTNSTPEQRRAIEKQLCESYRPTCNG